MEVNPPEVPMITLERLKDHYKHCIRLSASNKINAKNAFVLQLIDYMHKLVNQDDGQMNFKIASSALDVGAKIYSHRVDCVHSEAQKVASSILMALDGKNQKNHNHGDDNADNSKSDDTVQDGDINDSNEHNEDGEPTRTKKKKARQRNAKTVVDDHMTLNGKLEKIVVGDAYLDGLSREYDMSCPAALICYNPKTQPNGVLTIDSSFLNLDYTQSDNSLVTRLQRVEADRNSAEPNSDPAIPRPSTAEMSHPVSLANKSTNCALIIRDTKNSKICPRLETFVFRDRTTTIQGFNPTTEGDESRVFDIGGDMVGEVPSIDNGRDGAAEHRFQPDLYENQDDGDDFAMGDGPDHSDLNDFDNAQDNPIPNLDLIGAAAPNDYGYTDKPRLVDTWAGPHAWKAVKQTIKAELNGVMPKSARKRIKLEPKPIEFAEPHDESCLSLGDKELRYPSNAIKRWKKPFVPQDHNLDSDDVHQTLVSQFLRTEEKYSLVKEVLQAANEQQKRSADFPDRDNLNGFSSPMMPQSPPMAFDDYHDDSDDEFHADPAADGNEIGLFSGLNKTLTQNADGEFAGENLIDQPFSVAHIHISYAKVAKKMDIRRLKRAMWDLLLPPEKRDMLDTTVVPNLAITAEPGQNRVTFGDQVNVTNAESLDKTIQEEQDTTNCTTKADDSIIHFEFSDLYGELPRKINPKMAHDLSQPIAFVTLLHLANEKNLRLIPKPDLNDFIIEME